MSRILIAPDSFKGSATSIEVGQAIAKGWKTVRPDDEVVQLPFADGGEGTLLAIESARPDVVRNYCTEVSPNAYWLLMDGSTAIVELAQVSGLNLLPTLDPLGAHTFAFGQVLAIAARDWRVNRIYCALGGSASTDAGVGALMALGVQFLDLDGESVERGGGELAKIKSIVANSVISPPLEGVVLLVDVDSPLLGVNGAVAMYSPQKGASSEQIIELNSALKNFADVTGYPDSSGLGAAGGTAFGLCALWGASVKSGAEMIAQLCGVQTALEQADLVITGEGRLDQQSFQGKVVGYISELAKARNIPIAYCVGSIEGNFPSSAVGGVTLTGIAGSSDLAMENPERYLVEAGVKLANFL